MIISCKEQQLSKAATKWRSGTTAIEIHNQVTQWYFSCKEQQLSKAATKWRSGTTAIEIRNQVTQNFPARRNSYPKLSTTKKSDVIVVQVILFYIFRYT